VASSALALGGGFAHGLARELLWLGSVCVDLTGGLVGFVVAFITSVTLWWLYFDSSAEAASEKIAHSDDPGRLGRPAYHLIHPVMVAGIIVTAAADEKVLSDLDIAANTASAWMILGGPALFLLGHAAFKFVVWQRVPGPGWPGSPRPETEPPQVLRMGRFRRTARA
jgi:hypothetical protein